ncbi:alpha/beta fold hydrolase [Sedimentitalea arenosa]|uniref:Alpha/beta fold hydrolase n=1 Tax=Sedimentitalea arenosa TaxID=2798803 RepID=A0A8J7LW83_9RHOB|nr:alpha/beta fold hydrolase [Arenibacterium arenosum]MBJ6371811.1 alpha/beta fold hydrolase [Arenibacterium arenosum]
MSVIFWLILAVPALLIALAVFRTRRMAAEAERLVPQAGQVVEVRGGAVHHVDLGPRDAPVLVMIHGLSGQLQHFTYALTALLSDDFRVIAVDRPGCGYSRRDGEALATPGEQGRMILEALDALGVESAVLVGHSLGGTVALAMAMDRPERVEAVALLAPATQPQQEAHEVFRGLMVRRGWLRRLIGATIAVPLAAATRDKVLDIVFAPEPVAGDFMLRGGGALGLRPVAFVTASEDVVALQSVGAAQAARYETDLSVTGGLLFGSADPILSHSLHGHLMQAHGLSCELLEGRGHMLPITAPEDCARFIRDIARRRG